jgi:predicted transposase YbfD/YdcC
MPSLEGKTVTADPLHCQKETARIIVEKGGEYFLQIKGNQPKLLEHARTQASGTPLLPRPHPATGELKSAR